MHIGDEEHKKSHQSDHLNSDAGPESKAKQQANQPLAKLTKGKLGNFELIEPLPVNKAGGKQSFDYRVFLTP